MSCTPLVTIITPAYNRGTLIAATIESVLGQDYPNIEYIVLDDGSTDRTLEVIKQYEGRLRWESHANMGEARTVNKGFELSQGTIIGVVNSDDPLLPGAISKAVNTLSAHPGAVVVYPDWQLIDAQGTNLQVIRCRDFVSRADMVRGHYCLPGPGAFFRRTVIDGTGGRDPAFRYVGDFDFWLRAATLGDFVRIPEVMATFRTHADSASVCSASDDMAREHLGVIEKVFKDCSEQRELQKIKNESFLNAYHAAVCFCGNGNLREKKRYIGKSIKSAPAIFFSKYKYRIIIYTFLLIGLNYNSVYYVYKKYFGIFKNKMIMSF